MPFKRVLPWLLTTTTIEIIFIFSVAIAGGGARAAAQTENVTVLESQDLADLSISVEGINQNLEGAAAAAERLADFTDRLFEFLVMFATITIALWQRKSYINVIATLVVFFTGILWLGDYPGIAIPLMSFSGWFMYKTAYQPLYQMVRDWRQWRSIKPWGHKT